MSGAPVGGSEVTLLVPAVESMGSGLLLRSLLSAISLLMLPPGVAPNRPETVALSLKTPPTRPEAGAWVVSIAGPAGVTSTGSAAQPDRSEERRGGEEWGATRA